MFWGWDWRGFLKRKVRCNCIGGIFGVFCWGGVGMGWCICFGGDVWGGWCFGWLGCGGWGYGG